MKQTVKDTEKNCSKDLKATGIKTKKAPNVIQPFKML